MGLDHFDLQVFGGIINVLEDINKTLKAMLEKMPDKPVYHLGRDMF